METKTAVPGEVTGRVTRKVKVRRGEKAGIKFPVGRVERYMRQHRVAGRIGSGAAVYVAAVLEYLTAEILELAGDAAKDNKKKRIQPRHIQLAVRSDMELNTLLQGITIADGGVLPNIQPVLLPKKKQRNLTVAPKKHKRKSASKKPRKKPKKQPVTVSPIACGGVSDLAQFVGVQPEKTENGTEIIEGLNAVYLQHDSRGVGGTRDAYDTEEVAQES